MPRTINKQVAVSAATKAWEMVQRDLTREDFIDAAEELADFFQSAADAAREDAAAEGEEL